MGKPPNRHQTRSTEEASYVEQPELDSDAVVGFVGHSG
jgi:hypothetical protein